MLFKIDILGGVAKVLAGGGRSELQSRNPELLIYVCVVCSGADEEGSLISIVVVC